MKQNQEQDFTLHLFYISKKTSRVIFIFSKKARDFITYLRPLFKLLAKRKTIFWKLPFLMKASPCNKVNRMAHERMFNFHSHRFLRHRYRTFSLSRVVRFIVRTSRCHPDLARFTRKSEKKRKIAFKIFVCLETAFATWVL